MTLLEALARQFPLEGLALVALYRYWPRPVQASAVIADVPPGAAAPIVNATVQLGTQGIPVARLTGEVLVTPFPGVPHPSDPKRTIHGFAVIGPDDLVAAAPWDAARPVERGEELEVTFDLWVRRGG